jgi:hypothetical protein
MQVVMDKSYLQGASANTVRNICAEHAVLFLETLLYELLTTENEAARTACFAKLREMNDNVVLCARSAGDRLPGTAR